jgi:hypothetical protein
MLRHRDGRSLAILQHYIKQANNIAVEKRFEFENGGGQLIEILDGYPFELEGLAKEDIAKLKINHNAFESCLSQVR